MTASRKTRVGISIGDINGIGPEVIINTLQDKRIFKYCDVIVYGSAKVLSFYRKQMGIQNFEFNEVADSDKLNPKIINVFNCVEGEVNIEPGKPSKDTGDLALKAIDKAIEDIKDNRIDVMVTAPINKHTIKVEDTDFRGHTEYIAKKVGSNDDLMLLVNGNLRVGMVTNHIAVKDIPKQIDVQSILKKIEVLNTSLVEDFLIAKPKIAVLGLNPHSGDGNLIGKEETEIIAPAINKAKEKGIIAMGPYSADGFFGSGAFKNFDAVLAMFHDQGLVPFKVLSFGEGVNYTAGLPIVRTSPDHGTAYDIVGKNLSEAESFRQAIFTGLDIFNNRIEHKQMHENALK